MNFRIHETIDYNEYEKKTAAFLSLLMTSFDSSIGIRTHPERNLVTLQKSAFSSDMKHF